MIQNNITNPRANIGPVTSFKYLKLVITIRKIPSTKLEKRRLDSQLAFRWGIKSEKEALEKSACCLIIRLMAPVYKKKRENLIKELIRDKIGRGGKAEGTYTVKARITK